MKKLEGASFYEERLLFLLIRLRNPRARVVFVTSQPVHPLVLEYYFQLLVGIPASHARSRLTLLCAHDASPRSLTEKILERPRLIERIRAGHPRPRRGPTSPSSTPRRSSASSRSSSAFRSTASTPRSTRYGTKSGSRKIFREAGIACPDGFEDLRDDARHRGGARRRSSAGSPASEKRGREAERQLLGRGQRGLPLPRGAGRSRRGGPRDAPARSSSRCRWETWDDYHGKFRRMGGIAEEFLEAPVKTSPSVQLRIDPHGDGHPDLHARPDPGRTERPGLSRLPLSGRGRVPHADPRRGPADRRRPRREGRREPLRRSTSSLTRDDASTRPGRPGPSRSTSAWAARRTPTSRSSS